MNGSIKRLQSIQPKNIPHVLGYFPMQIEDF